MCAHLKYSTLRTHSSPLLYSERRPVRDTQWASCSSSSVESSAKITAKSVFESYKVSDGVASRQTLSSLFLKDEEELSTQADWFWIEWLVWFYFSELPQQIFCKVNSIFLLLHHGCLAVGSGLAQGRYLILGEPPQKLTAKNKQNWMMADRWYSPKQDGSQEQNLCHLVLEENPVVWRCSFYKGKGLPPGSH